MHRGACRPDRQLQRGHVGTGRQRHHRQHDHHGTDADADRGHDKTRHNTTDSRQNRQRRDQNREQYQDHSITGVGRDSLTRGRIAAL